ncbi:conserved hypothetical protein [Candidatus Magnetomoraceae bacterium gMMP-15]
MKHQENRLDRIEKNLESFMQGIAQLRESQMQTDEQQRKTDEKQKNIDKRIEKLLKSQEKTDEQFLKLRESQMQTDEQILKLRESQMQTDQQQKKTNKLIEKLRESQMQTDQQQKKTDKLIEKLRESQMQTDRQIKRTNKQLGDMGLIHGEVAEDLFYRNVKFLFRDRDLNFDSVKRNLKKKGFAEYDIVAMGKDTVLVVEVKNKLSTRMIDRFVKKSLPKFKEVFPKYKKLKLLGGMGGLIVKDEVWRYAEDLGLFVLTQSSDGGATIANKKNFRGKIF